MRLFSFLTSLLLPLSLHESLLGKLIKSKDVVTNPIHLNDVAVLMVLVIPEDWRNTSLPATTRKRDGPGTKIASC